MSLPNDFGTVETCRQGQEGSRGQGAGKAYALNRPSDQLMNVCRVFVLDLGSPTASWRSAKSNCALTIKADGAI